MHDSESDYDDCFESADEDGADSKKSKTSTEKIRTKHVSKEENKEGKRRDKSEHSEDDEITETRQSEINERLDRLSFIVTEQPNVQPEKFAAKFETDNPESLWSTEDGWEKFDEKPTEASKKDEKEEDTGWSSWGNWGVSSLLSTATQSVTTITSQVSQGITSVLENSLGVVDPEEMARMNKKDEAVQERVEEIDNSKNSNSHNSHTFGLGNLVKLVESTGSKVITGGLDTLETIGKKTMEVLQEGDPGLRKKRAFLKINQNKPILSQLLREAKEKAENKDVEEKSIKKTINYEAIFDDCEGLLHLEALELLSKQCELKLESILTTKTDSDAIDFQETLDQVKELCELPEEDEEAGITDLTILKNQFELGVSQLDVKINYEDLISTWIKKDEEFKEANSQSDSESELHHIAIETLASLTAIGVERFHKIAELLLVKKHRSTTDEADSLLLICSSLSSLLSIVTTTFTDSLHKRSEQSEKKEHIKSLITNIFYEGDNSTYYIRNALQLLIPILQIGAV